MKKDTNIKNAVVAIFLLLGVAIIVSLTACSNAQPIQEKTHKEIMAESIPDPYLMFNSDDIQIQNTTEEYYQFFVVGVDEYAFKQYMEACKNVGYTDSYYYSSDGAYYCKSDDGKYDLNISHNSGKSGNEPYLFVSLHDLNYEETEESE